MDMAKDVFSQSEVFLQTLIESGDLRACLLGTFKKCDKRPEYKADGTEKPESRKLSG